MTNLIGRGAGKIAQQIGRTAGKGAVTVARRASTSPAVRSAAAEALTVGREALAGAAKNAFTVKTGIGIGLGMAAAYKGDNTAGENAKDMLQAATVGMLPKEVKVPIEFALSAAQQYQETGEVSGEEALKLLISQAVNEVPLPKVLSKALPNLASTGNLRKGGKIATGEDAAKSGLNSVLNGQTGNEDIDNFIKQQYSKASTNFDALFKKN
ncbi:MAG: hypothetical protein AAF621_00830 [Pseudomonadota bacterium]